MIDTTNNKEVIDQLEFLKNRLHEDDSIAALDYAIKYLQSHNAFWIYQTTRKYDIYKCSHCGYIWIDDEGLPDYCCDCGYQMSEHEDNEEYRREELEIIKRFEEDNKEEEKQMKNPTELLQTLIGYFKTEEQFAKGANDIKVLWGHPLSEYISALNRAIEVLNEHDLTTSAIEQALDNLQNNTKLISTKDKQEKMDIQQALSVLKDMHKANKHLSNQDDMGNRKDSFKEAADALAIAIESLETPKYLYNLLQCVDGKIYTIGNSEEYKETNCANCKYKNEEQ